MPEYEKVTKLFSKTKTILETTSRDAEDFNGDSVLLSEEKIKKAERLLFNIMQFCNRVSARHEPVKDPKVYQEFKKYEILNNVK